VAPYEPDAGGVLRVVLPERCVHAKADETCSLFIDHHRPRKTGPGFPLAVVGCSRHPVTRYTLYPPGHVPHGRVAVVPCSPSGPLLQASDTGQPAWRATLLDAAHDAADRDWWPAHSPADDRRRRRTQGWHLQRVGLLLGVHPATQARTRERIATRLRVPTMTLRSAAHHWTHRWQAQGAAVISVLAALPHDASLLDRVLAAGAQAGLWPPPQRWDAGRRIWVRPRSRSPKRPVGGPSRSRASPPTTSRTDAAADAGVSSAP